MPHKPANIVQRITAQKLIEHENGALRIMGIPGMAFPLMSLAFALKAITTLADTKKAYDIIYLAGMHQSYAAMQFGANKIGIKNPVTLVRSVISQSQISGLGDIQIKRMNLEQKRATLVCHTSPFAKKMLQVFGPQKDPVDHYIRGMAAGVFKYAFGETVAVIETECEAMKNRACVFEVSTLEFAQDNYDKSIQQKQIADMKNIPKEIQEKFTIKNLISC